MDLLALILILLAILAIFFNWDLRLGRRSVNETRLGLILFFLAVIAQWVHATGYWVYFADH